MARFRETLWFKKGNDDAEAAQQRQKRGTLDPGGIDQLPVEDRYVDDGTLTPIDSAQWSVKTGMTQAIQPMSEAEIADLVTTAAGPDVHTHVLVHEMKAGRGKVFAMIGASVVALGVVVAMFVA